jgi:hypothetical protein
MPGMNNKGALTSRELLKEKRIYKKKTRLQIPLDLTVKALKALEAGPVYARG